MKSKGAVEFARLPGSAAEKAAKFGVSEATVSYWASGARTPKAPARERIAAEGGPRPEDWDVSPEPVERVHVDATPATPDAVMGEADSLLVELRTLRQEIAQATNQTLDARLRMAERVGSLIASVGKLTGVAVLSERRILASPAARVIEDRLIEALKPWPDALRACGEALAAMRVGP